jgi:hypothetical protein
MYNSLAEVRELCSPMSMEHAWSSSTEHFTSRSPFFESCSHAWSVCMPQVIQLTKDLLRDARESHAAAAPESTSAGTAHGHIRHMPWSLVSAY